jgi:uncharacterized membrane protein
MKKAKQVGARLVRFVFARPNLLGLLSGTAWFCFSLTPSLMPRPWLLQAIVSGISLAAGYGIGVGLSWAVRKVLRKEPSEKVKRYAWPILLSVCAVGALTFLVLSFTWQNEVRALLEVAPAESGHRILIFLGASLVAALLILFARLVCWLVKRTDRIIKRWVPHRFTGAAAVVIVGVGLYFVLNGVAFKVFITIANNVYRGANNTTPAGAVRPVSALRSGSDASLIAWEDLGKQGRRFISGGPSAKALQAFSGKPPAEPIRVYAGFDTANTPKARAALAVKELERTGAFSRPVLLVLTPTGTGWVHPQTVDALEYMWNGNTAVVAAQYSYLPSWISFLVDRSRATETGRELFNQVYAKWSALPISNRPKLIAYGLSLGSYGMQAAFSGEDDLRARTNGALFVGTPSFTFVWRDITANRQPGSPAWQPTYHNGRTIRFASNGAGLAKPAEAWTNPKVAYLQHASDPVVWLAPDLLFRQPGWLKEPRGPDVSSKVHWYPVSTFLHLTVDQFMGTTVADGHGHLYQTAPIDALAAIAPPADWTGAHTTRLKQIISTYPDK